MSQWTTPNPKLPRYTEDHAEPADWAVMVPVTALIGMCGLLAGSLVGMLIDALGYGGLGFEHKDGLTAPYTSCMVVFTIITIAGAFWCLRGVYYVYPPILHQSRDHRLVFIQYNDLDPEQQELASAAYDAVRASSPGTEQMRLAMRIWYDTHDQLLIRDQLLQTEIMSPHIENAQYSLDSIRHQVAHLRENN